MQIKVTSQDDKLIFWTKFLKNLIQRLCIYILLSGFNELLKQTYPDIYTTRDIAEKNLKYRYYRLPYTAPVPIGRRLLRQLIANRNNQSNGRWMSHDWFKFLLGCTAGVCLSILIMMYFKVRSIQGVRDVNIMFLSFLVGATVTFLVFKVCQI